jgi:carboxymethylenebutenolidase
MVYEEHHREEEILARYLTGRVDRREFLRRVALIGGGSALALTFAGALSCAPSATPTPTIAPKLPPGPGEMVAPSDSRIEAGPVEFQSGEATLMGYLARPKSGGPHPTVLVLHENTGMLPHFPDVARRLALEGYVALALDLLGRHGGTASYPDIDAAKAAQGAMPEEQTVSDMNAAVDYIRGLSGIRPDRVGVIGFCRGGTNTMLLAVRNPNIFAAVPFYGSNPPLEELANTNAAILNIIPSEDAKRVAMAPELEAAMQQYGKVYKGVTYEGAKHSFFNDQKENRYHPQAAAAAWQETLGWFEQHLKG